MLVENFSRMDARMFRAASQNGWRADGIPGCEAVEADPPMTEKTEKEGGGENDNQGK